jgi:hypothetical protein
MKGMGLPRAPSAGLSPGITGLEEDPASTGLQVSRCLTSCLGEPLLAKIGVPKGRSSLGTPEGADVVFASPRSETTLVAVPINTSLIGIWTPLALTDDDSIPL